MVRTGVMRAYGGDLRRVIGLALRHRLAAFAAGLGVTGILQSSTATALITASFAERGLMATAPALAVMLGADVGTSLVVQALSFRFEWLSPLFVLAGVVAFMAGKTSRHRDLGRAAIGLGLMLLALHSIVATTEPIRSSATLETILGALAGEPLMALVVAAGLTWLAHSSVAIILLIVSLAVAGLIPLGLAVALHPRRQSRRRHSAGAGDVARRGQRAARDARQSRLPAGRLPAGAALRRARRCRS